MYVLALEASTQAAKAAVVSQGGLIISQVTENYPGDVSDVVSMDAEKVYEVLLRVGAAAVAGAKRSGVTDIAAAGLCTIWQSLLPTDASGHPLMRAQTWAHTGAGPLAAAFRENRDESLAYYRATGCVPHSQLTSFQAAHLRESNQTVYDEAAYIGSLGSYLIGKMTGAQRSSRCTMAGSGWLSMHALDWEERALAISGVSADRLPALCDASEPLMLGPQAAAALGVGVIPLAAGGGDGGLNQIGSGALKEGVATCSVGTSGALRIACRAPALSDPPATWCYYIDQGWFVAGVSTSGACNCVDWARETLFCNRPFSLLEQAMQQARDRWAQAPVFLPFLWGERAPGWDDARTGGYVGLRGGHDAGDVYYATLEGVLMLLRMGYEGLAGQIGEPVSINLSGGICNSRPWMQMAADLFGRPIEISPVANASLMGAAGLALVAGGALGDLADFPVPRGETIEPDDSMKDHYAARLARFKEAYFR